jgi:uncharacterized protein (TIGR02246 family)
MQRAGRSVISGACALMIALGVALGAPAPASAADSKRALQDQAQAVLTAAIDAFNRGDFEGFMRLYAANDDVAYVYDGQLWVGVEQIRSDYAGRFFRDLPAAGRPSADWLKIEVSRVAPLAPDLLLVTARVVPIAESTSKPAPASVTTLLMRQIEGTWRVLYDHTS